MTPNVENRPTARRHGSTPRSGLRLSLLLALTLSSAALGTSVVAAGQDPPSARGRGESAAPNASDGDGGDTDDGDDGSAAESREVEEGGSKVKVMRFTGLDISGRLKSPQLLYFLNRLRAEFDRPKLPHRSFIPELVRSAHEESF